MPGLMPVSERLRQPSSILAAWLVVQVTLRGRVVLVAHVGLDGVGIERRDRRRAEAMAKVMEAKPAKSSPLQRPVVALAKVVVIQMLTLAGG
jgi:hypothetical protein